MTWLHVGSPGRRTGSMDAHYGMTTPCRHTTVQLSCSYHHKISVNNLLVAYTIHLDVNAGLRELQKCSGRYKGRYMPEKFAGGAG